MTVETKTLINSYRYLKPSEPIDLSVLQLLETQSPTIHVLSYKNVLLNSCPTLFFNKNSSYYTFNDRMTNIDFQQSKNTNTQFRSFLNIKTNIEKNINNYITVDSNIQTRFVEILAGRNIMLLKSVRDKSIEENSDTLEYTKILDSTIFINKNIDNNLVISSKKPITSFMYHLYTTLDSHIHINSNKRMPDNKIINTEPVLLNIDPEQKYVFSKNYDANVVIPIRSEGVIKVILPTTPTEESSPPIIISGNILQKIYLNTNSNSFFSITLESDIPIASILNLPKHVQYYQPTTTLSGYLYNQKEHEMRVFFDNGESMVLVLKTDGITKHLI